MNKLVDLDSQPLCAIWETTAAPNASGDDSADSVEQSELTDEEAEQFIRDVAELRPPIFVFAGSDPLKRDRIHSLVQYAASCDLHPAMVLTPSSAFTRETIDGLKKAGLSRLGFTLNGSEGKLHDLISGVPGSFARTLEGIKWAKESRLPVQVHTTVSKRNLQDLEGMAHLLKRFTVLVWSLTFPVPAQGEKLKDPLSADEFEQAFARIYALSQKMPFKVKTVEAPHYRRFVVQQRARSRTGPESLVALHAEAETGIPGILPLNDNAASIYISSAGEVFPSQSLRVSVGNVRRKKLAEMYGGSELLGSLRDPAMLKGKCGDCEFQEVCGGSRARAWATTGDMFAQEENCSYQPVLARKIG